jgi:hypothetical protein
VFADDFWLDPSVLPVSGLRYWTAEQTLGDLIIVPPLVPHQVLNMVREYIYAF